jgi:hypothetical protein
MRSGTVAAYNRQQRRHCKSWVPAVASALQCERCVAVMRHGSTVMLLHKSFDDVRQPVFATMIDELQRRNHDINTLTKPTTAP